MESVAVLWAEWLSGIHQNMLNVNINDGEHFSFKMNSISEIYF